MLFCVVSERNSYFMNKKCNTLIKMNIQDVIYFFFVYNYSYTSRRSTTRHTKQQLYARPHTWSTQQKIHKRRTITSEDHTHGPRRFFLNESCATAIHANPACAPDLALESGVFSQQALKRSNITCFHNVSRQHVVDPCGPKYRVVEVVRIPTDLLELVSVHNSINT